MSLVSLVAVGDVLVGSIRDPFAKTASIIKKADLAFCNVEGPYFSGQGTIYIWSRTWEPNAATPGGARSPPRGIINMADAGFDVVSFANNHSLDWGQEAFLETMELLEENKIEYTGAGRNIAEARKPAILERKGIRFAFLSYASEYKWGWTAGDSRPGIATVRVHPLYAPPHVNKEEMEAMMMDIKGAKEKADVVIVSDHWGVSGGITLTPHQEAIGHACIDAGADLVLGGHPHVLQGIEIYKGKILCYSLGNFVFGMDFESMLCNFIFSKDGVKKAFFYPIVPNALRQPEIQPPESEKFKIISERMNKLCREVGTNLKVEKDKICIEM
jgi:hypothetical protein